MANKPSAAADHSRLKIGSKPIRPKFWKETIYVSHEHVLAPHGLVESNKKKSIPTIRGGSGACVTLVLTGCDVGLWGCRRGQLLVLELQIFTTTQTSFCPGSHNRDQRVHTLQKNLLCIQQNSNPWPFDSRNAFLPPHLHNTCGFRWDVFLLN